MTGPIRPRTGRSVREVAESRASVSALAAFAVGFTVIAISMWGERLPLAGAHSLATRTAWMTAGVTAAAFVVAFVGATRDGTQPWRRRLPAAKRLVDLIALTLAVAAVSSLAVEALANLFQLGFVGLTVDALGGGALAGAVAAASAYFVSGLGSDVTTESLAVLATAVLLVGTMASMLTASDARWWELHFSQLGNLGGNSGATFNGALVLAGLVITVVANYAARDAARGLRLHRAEADLAQDPGEAFTADDPERRIARRVSAITWLFTAIGLMMCVAGLIHDALNSFVHVGAASGMVVAFGLVAVLSLFALPGLPHEYRVLTVAVLAGVVVSIVLWIPVGYYNLTGVEFVSAGLIFSWFIVFSRVIAAYARRGSGEPA